MSMARDDGHTAAVPVRTGCETGSEMKRLGASRPAERSAARRKAHASAPADGDWPFPLSISTGLTDLDYSEVTNGLTEQDTVLVLPSASLVNAQKQFQQRVQSFTGGGIPGLRQQAPATPSTGTQRNPVPR